MSNRAYAALEALQLDKPSSQASSTTSSSTSTTRAVVSHRIERILSRRNKPDRSLDQNPTIKSFRDISRRSLRATKFDIDTSADSDFRPFDKKKLLSRLATFQKVTNWDVQNTRLTPLRCATHGWNCNTSRQNELMCLTCGARLAIKVPEASMDDDDDNDGMEFDIVESIVDKYLQDLHDRHNTNCPWKKQSTPLSVYEISFNTMDDVVGEFKERYQRNVNRLRGLDNINIVSVLSDDEIEIVKKWLRKQSVDVTDNDSNAIDLAVFGWDVELQGKYTVLVSPSDARRFIVDAKGDSMNPLDEHQPWSCFTTGYKTLVKILEVLSHETKPFDDTLGASNDNHGDNDNDDNDDDDDDTNDDAGNNAFQDTLSRLAKMKDIYFK
ncbi:CYFA0S34e00584g1_1 [Cyberlindnera fabianii]|uniref:CYFA0S34e00584g1_1 n=1 Tax=Cyberlindnera fabianii TaxID=36022 RepID=A0A061BKR4_CYBFA|nr:CYFA0S34e00584g1_1 [Cyberlindnera fabianii]